MSWPHGWMADSWLYPCLLLALLAAWGVVRGYRRAAGSWQLKSLLACLKLVGIGLLLLCLVEPLRRSAVPRQDANLLLMVADASQSLRAQDAAATETREDRVRRLLEPTTPWQAQLEEDFDVRRFMFGERLEGVDEFAAFTADQEASHLYQALGSLADRFAGQPCAGCLLFTDGNATDLPTDLAWDQLPPIYPVVVASRAARDMAIHQVSVSQTNFESAPVTITAELMTQGCAGRSVAVRLLGEAQQEIARQVVARVEDGKRFTVRFEVRPEKKGIHFYEVQAFDSAAESLAAVPSELAEATLENNRYPIVVDRGAGPYRILYVSGRPNWELKFLRRALAEDDEIDLNALVRIARREPKFSFRSREDGQTNPLFRGFADRDSEQTEQYDEPVLVTLPVEGEQAEVLRRGFPRTAAELFAYQALVLDDIEAGFFNAETQALIEQFVSDRGGSLLMLGGAESFAAGGYDRTPIGAMLPVYLQQSASAPATDDFRLRLTRDGWLQEWVRIRPTEPQEQRRLEAMPPFQTLNRSALIKPGATPLAEVQDRQGQVFPALVVQRFGRGHAAAWLLGDLWRWQLRDAPDEDLMTSWRQTARWLVADVPQRLEVQLDPGALARMQVRVQVRDAEFQPLDNCQVRLAIRPHTVPEPNAGSEPPPESGAAVDEPQPWELLAEAAEDEPGVYHAQFAPREPGPYRIEVIANQADGSEIGRRETGWVQRRQAAEFQTLDANLAALEQIALRTGGQLLNPADLAQFANSIPTNPSMITETRVEPWWHQWPLFVAAITCLVLEWGVRRWRGMP